MPDPSRPPDLSTLALGDLERTRRELAAALALTPADVCLWVVGTGPEAGALEGLRDQLSLKERVRFFGQQVHVQPYMQAADCLVCHNQVDPPDSCEFCHPRGAQLKPANHVPGFLDSHTNKNSGLDLQTCAVCHGRKFTCLGCHLK